LGLKIIVIAPGLAADGFPQCIQLMAAADPVPGIPARCMHQFAKEEHHGVFSLRALSVVAE
jgi:hypothetical protein